MELGNMHVLNGPGTWNKRTGIAKVDVAKCRDVFLSFSYADDGWNPYSSILAQYEQNPDLTYEESIYKTYLEKCQLSTTQQLVFVDDQPNLPPMDRGWIPYPWFPGTKPMDMKNHFGPRAPFSPGPREFVRMIRIYLKLKREGYRPESYPDGYIRGYFLRGNSDYRFHILGGNHRMAALGFLGYRFIDVKVQPVGGKGIVDLCKVNEWPNVRNGLYNRALAIRVFQTVFAKTGRERAESLGIYSRIFPESEGG